jgi:hypothetical protein
MPSPVLLALLLADARAWTPDLVEIADVPPDLRVVARSGDQLVAGGLSETWMLTESGAAVAKWSLAATAFEPFGFSDGTVLGCGATGLWYVERDGAAFEEPIRVEATPCEAVSTLGSRVVLARSGEVITADVEFGELADVQPTGVTLAGAPWLVRDGSHVFASDTGGTILYDLSGSGTTASALGGDLGGLALAGADVGWTLTDRGVLVTTAGEQPVAASPGAFVAADVDDDGRLDFLVAHEGAWIGVYLGSGDTQRIDLAATSLAAWPDTEECADVAVVADGKLWRVTATDCGVDRDDDGDGVSEAQGDCDDRDGSVRPGAAELCDDVDQDCDGVARPTGPARILSVSGQPEPVEGEIVELDVEIEGCAASLVATSDPPLDWSAWLWSTEGRGAATASPDAGPHVVTVTVTASDGSTDGAEATFTASDLVPSARLALWTPDLVVGDVLSAEVQILSPYEADLELEVISGPDDLVITPIEPSDGWTIGWRADEPTEGVLDVAVIDDEGNRTELVPQPFRVVGGPEDRGCGRGAASLLLLPLALRRRRRS